MVRAVVLAAGESRRMGAPKMLLPWGGGTILGAVVRMLLTTPVHRVVVVLGHRAEEVETALQPFAGDGRVAPVVNPDYRLGMLTSVQCGVRAAGPGAVLVALGDQPLVGAETVRRLLAGHRGGLTVPAYGGRRGHPVLVDATLAGALLDLPPDQGLRGLFRGYPHRVTVIPVPDPGVLIDLDTPGEYRCYQWYQEKGRLELEASL